MAFTPIAPYVEVFVQIIVSRRLDGMHMKSFLAQFCVCRFMTYVLTTCEKIMHK